MGCFLPVSFSNKITLFAFLIACAKSKSSALFFSLPKNMSKTIADTPCLTSASINSACMLRGQSLGRAGRFKAVLVSLFMAILAILSGGILGPRI